MRKPNLFIVGAAKCGTTSLYRYLRLHPEIFMSERKEPGFFGRDLDPLYRDPRISESAYIVCFANAGEEKYVGEATPSYIYSKQAAMEIRRFRPDAKIIIMLRDPVEMLHSYHSQQLYTGNETIADFEEALAAEPDRRRGERIPRNAPCLHYYYYREKVQYADQVARYFEAFGRDSVHVILFDDFIRDTAKVYRETLEFLGVDPEFRPDFEVYNPNRRPRFKSLRGLIKSPGLRKAAAALVPRVLRRKAYLFLLRTNSRIVPRPSLKLELRNRLRNELKGEVEKLSGLLNRDLSHWLKEDAVRS